MTVWEQIKNHPEVRRLQISPEQVNAVMLVLGGLTSPELYEAMSIACRLSIGDQDKQRLDFLEANPKPGTIFIDGSPVHANVFAICATEGMPLRDAIDAVRLSPPTTH